MKFTFSIILFFYISLCTYAGELVIIRDSERSAYGFLVKDTEKTYLYTSQSAIFGMKIFGVGYKFNAKTISGKTVNVSGNMKIAYNCDVARIAVKGDFEDGFEIGTQVKMGEKISIFTNAASGDKKESNVTGIGLNSFSFMDKSNGNYSGTPILGNDGKVIGVVSQRDRVIAFNLNEKSKKSKKSKKDKKKKKIVFKQEPAKEFFKYVSVNNSLASRLHRNIKWGTIDKTGFIVAGEAIEEAYKIQKEYMVLLNWWYQNPYRSVPEDLKYPKDLYGWVKYNNERTPIIRKFIDIVAADPIKHKNKMIKLRDNCLHRARLFYTFPSSQYAKLQQKKSKWKTQFLSRKASHYLANWKTILVPLQCKIKSMKYKMPHKFK